MNVPMVQKSETLTGLASGTVRTSIFSAWAPYNVQTYSKFEQTTFTHPGPPYKWGGPWYMNRSWDRRNSISANTSLISGTLVLGGRSQAYSALAPYLTPSLDEERAIATKLWNMALPNKPTVDLPVAIGELIRDGIPGAPGHTAWKEIVHPLRGLSGEYLNIQFGWNPLISDVRKLAYAVKNADRIISGYAGTGGFRKVNRRRELPPISETKHYNGSFVVLPNQANVFATSGGSTEYREQRQWFVGNFKYYVPMGDDLASRFRRYKQYANKLLGVRLTPDILWDLAPWSWAVDWFVDVGSVIENIASFGPDGIHAADGYYMRHNYYSNSSWGIVNSKGITGTLVQQSGQETKYRRMASPFGFDATSLSDLSPRQYSIAIALGLAHGGSGVPQSR
nr:MAG: hypothetical protein 1 [Leviviridae sp.]